MLLLRLLALFVSTVSLAGAAPLPTLSIDRKPSEHYRREITDTSTLVPVVAGSTIFLTASLFGAAYYIKSLSISKALDIEYKTRFETFQNWFDYPALVEKVSASSESTDKQAVNSAVGELYDLLHQTFAREQSLAARRISKAGSSMTEVEKAAVQIHADAHASALKTLQSRGRSMTRQEMLDFIQAEQVERLVAIDSKTTGEQLNFGVSEALYKWYVDQQNQIQAGAKKFWSQSSTKFGTALDQLRSESSETAEKALGEAYETMIQALQRRQVLNSLEMTKYKQGLSALTADDVIILQEYSSAINEVYSYLRSGKKSTQKLSEAMEMMAGVSYARDIDNLMRDKLTTIFTLGKQKLEGVRNIILQSETAKVTAQFDADHGSTRQDDLEATTELEDSSNSNIDEILDSPSASTGSQQRDSTKLFADAEEQSTDAMSVYVREQAELLAASGMDVTAINGLSSQEIEVLMKDFDGRVGKQSAEVVWRGITGEITKV